MLAGVGMGAPALALEQKRQHWLLRSGGRWEAVAGTNCVGAARARSICVGAKINTNRLHTNWNKHVVQDSIKNTYNTIVLCLHKNPNL